MSEYEGSPLEAAWLEDPATTAAYVIDATVSARVGQVLEQHVAPAIEQAQSDRWNRNSQDAWSAVEEKYGGPKSPGGFAAADYKDAFLQYLENHPYEFPTALVEEPQMLALKMEQVLRGEKANWDAQWAKREMDNIKRAGAGTAYTDGAQW